MKRFLLIPLCALFCMAFVSCQNEDKSALDLAKELTEELQKVTDYQTAENSARKVVPPSKR